jgi:hypothetical protein
VPPGGYCTAFNESGWTPAIDMPHADVAVAKYQPKDTIACVFRRVKLFASQIFGWVTEVVYERVGGLTQTVSYLGVTPDSALR